MEEKNKRIIFHIDVNSAYLSWTAVKQLQYGESLIDIREVPSIIGGNVEERHGIVLAKSIPAKKFNIKTGESILEALKKCPELKIYPADYNLFMKCSNAMYELLNEYSPLIQRYSVDEVFIEASHFNECYMEKANEIKMRIKKELGFAVNIGISENKLLAKMASDFKQKDAIHTLFKEEIKDKMWPLPVNELFMVGRATQKKLEKLNINTIGELAKYDLEILRTIFKSHGSIIHNYANGIDDSEVRKRNYIEIKGVGNSITFKRVISERNEAIKVILSLVETAAKRLRNGNNMCKVVVIGLKSNSFYYYSHQKSLFSPTDSTEEIYKYIVNCFDEAWKGEPIRQMGVRLTQLCSNEFYQRTMFDDNRTDKQRALDKAIDKIRDRFGDNSVIRSTFINSDIKPLSGGVGEEDYPMMGSIL